MVNSPLPSGPIYQPKGHAAPYAQLALNPYLTCSFRCPYCYNAVRNPNFFSDKAVVRGGSPDKLLADLDRQCSAIRSSFLTPQSSLLPPVHLTFLGDCYQPAEERLQLTRRCIQTLHKHGFPVQILTKAGELPDRDFDLLIPSGHLNPGTLEPLNPDSFGVTMTHPSADRVYLLDQARKHGIPIWLSLEPVESEELAVNVLVLLAKWNLHPDPLWIGPLNHRARPYDWPQVKAVLADTAYQLEIPVRFKDDA